MRRYRLRNINNWRSHHELWHTSTETVLRIAICDMGSEIATTSIPYDKPEKVFLHLDEWRNVERKNLRSQNSKLVHR